MGRCRQKWSWIQAALPGEPYVVPFLGSILQPPVIRKWVITSKELSPGMNEELVSGVCGLSILIPTLEQLMLLGTNLLLAGHPYRPTSKLNLTPKVLGAFEGVRHQTCPSSNVESTCTLGVCSHNSRVPRLCNLQLRKATDPKPQT